ncbi:hypothetical protein [Synoicihabitans lomoniglobus]|uniref:Uncharacterized protein n=1 Tax=Synoicihabitans lomoniglobus TaxID=2909285 RepID=A0AAF0I7T8_9BACT|nr:hypothetical protein [Opitutaceae bacterium LMO-M01]WED67006.1 hypothetical protein PXH66_09100 [Opitutaceae bacterium LMO-M01]
MSAHRVTLSLLAIALCSSCHNMSKRSEIWELAAIRIEKFQHGGVHYNARNGDRRILDLIEGTVLSAGSLDGKFLLLGRPTIEDKKEERPVLGKVYIANIGTEIDRALESSSNPPEWLILKKPNRVPVTD